ncbi:FG-GAP repeat domain-containing protein [Streptomyces omiyaensis]|uniref:FG-GAP repeat domain-containing protein n=1 Tax=Streptomyces omiyaensis TaxID=68247 RepID=UPI0036FB2802
MSGFATRRGVSAAITTVLAVTLGAGVLTAPAGAAPLTGAAVAEAGAQAAPLAYPANGLWFSAAGKTGFLTRGPVNGTYQFQWNRYADGSVTTIDAVSADSTGTDVIMTGKGQYPRTSLVLQLRDMAPGGGTVTMDLRPLNATYVKAVSRDTILAEVKKADGSVELHLVTSTGGTLTQRKVEGVPADAHRISAAPARDGSALVTFGLTGTSGSRYRAAVVDLAAAKVVSTHDGSPFFVNRYDDQHEYSAISATHLAWVSSEKEIVTVDRATGVRSSFDPQGAEGMYLATGLMGSWLTYGNPAHLEGDGFGETNPVLPYTAKSLTTGETVKLLDYVATAWTGPDGTMLVRGGTVEHGDGLFRISLGADGRPAVEPVASTGKPVQIRYLGQRFPDRFDLTSPAPLKWELSRSNADVDVRITHRATGKSFSKTLNLYTESAGSPHLFGDSTFGLTWSQIAAESPMGKDAETGVYDWSFTARPQNGVGPDAKASGTFTAGRHLSTQHDLDQDAEPDLLARDAAGVLWWVHTGYDDAKKTLVRDYSPTKIGPSWQIYDRIETIGGIGGGPTDFVARDRSGVLWLYDVTRTYKTRISARKQVGGGWNTYTQLTGGSDLDGDGRPDLVAVDKAGALWFYKNTGNVAAPFAARKKIGTGGWGVYNQITATSDIGGAGAGDLIARDKDGVLWLYLGKGDGTFTARRQIGGGWGAYTDTVGIGDGNRDGRPDLFAYGPNKTAYFYAGTGDLHRPFATRVASPVLAGQPAFNQVS